MILVTHTDLDGIGCEIVMCYFFPDLPSTSIYRTNYGIVDDIITQLLAETEDTVWISDLSPSQETAHYISSQYPNRFELFDHHKTAHEYLQGYDWATFKLDRCGTRILFEALCQRMPEVVVSDKLRQLVFHVNDVDMWHHESEESQKFNDLLYLLDADLFVKLMLERIHTDDPLISDNDRLYLQGLENYKQRYFEKCAHRAVVKDQRLVLIVSRHMSELAEYIRNIEPIPEGWENIKYIDMINVEGGYHSLRAYQADFDVSIIAKANGGGGHKSAAGFPIRDQEQPWLFDL